MIIAYGENNQVASFAPLIQTLGTIYNDFNEQKIAMKYAKIKIIQFIAYNKDVKNKRNIENISMT